MLFLMVIGDEIGDLFLLFCVGLIKSADIFLKTVSRILYILTDIIEGDE
jgi:hypothetical protein